MNFNKANPMKTLTFLGSFLCISSLFASACPDLEDSKILYGGAQGKALFDSGKEKIVALLCDRVKKLGTGEPSNAWIKGFVEEAIAMRAGIAQLSKSDDAHAFGMLRARAPDEHLVTPLHEARYLPFKKEVLKDMYARLSISGEWTQTGSTRTRLRVLAPKDWILAAPEGTVSDFTRFNEILDVDYLHEFISRGAFGTIGDKSVSAYGLAMTVQARMHQPGVPFSPSIDPAHLKPGLFVQARLTPACRLLRLDVEHQVAVHDKQVWIPGHGFMSLLPDEASTGEEASLSLPLMLLHTHSYFLPYLEPNYVEALKSAAQGTPDNQDDLITRVGRFVRLWNLNTPVARGSAACADFMMEGLFAGKGYKATFQDKQGLSLDHLCYATNSEDTFLARFKEAITLTPHP
ncbi:MAG: hypothetical protein C0514_02800 [Candidatus Puniceispirillum sp.]|nr:hypothetical protein [Candidatus Puniceispirillum sp.]